MRGVVRVGLLLGVLVVAGVAGVYWVGRSGSYEWQELVNRERYGRYDGLIAQAAKRHGVSPALVKAVIWRESKFQPRMTGSDGERGLMQITEAAAADWAQAEKIETFVPVDLFDPKVNIEAGTWYLARAMRHWSAKDDPVPFALAEYNAGRQRVKRWETMGEAEREFGAEELRRVMDFPTTRRYIADIVERYRRFEEDGEFGKF
ncbi:MAG: lytic transglycosylase domain-containing protein [Terrimicrobiaceae bacterium]|nr:lytic transglycosylase domain-containing protein [Terrimicrobiaceae bacterium]